METLIQALILVGIPLLIAAIATLAILGRDKARLRRRTRTKPTTEVTIPPMWVEPVLTAKEDKMLTWGTAEAPTPAPAVTMGLSPTAMEHLRTTLDSPTLTQAGTYPETTPLVWTMYSLMKEAPEYRMPPLMTATTRPTWVMNLGTATTPEQVVQAMPHSAQRMALMRELLNLQMMTLSPRTPLETVATTVPYQPMLMQLRLNHQRLMQSPAMSTHRIAMTTALLERMMPTFKTTEADNQLTQYLTQLTTGQLEMLWLMTGTTMRRAMTRGGS
jgi:hypothetical protein